MTKSSDGSCTDASKVALSGDRTTEDSCSREITHKRKKDVVVEADLPMFFHLVNVSFSNRPGVMVGRTVRFECSPLPKKKRRDPFSTQKKGGGRVTFVKITGMARPGG